jgi:AcrR family transcriptional regulator
VQARSRETQERLFSAAEGLFAKNGIAETTIQDIVTAAEASIGSFYARFEDKQAFLAAFYARYYDTGSARQAVNFSADEWEGHSAAELIVRWIELRIRYFRERRDLVRAVLMHTRAHHEPEFRRHAARFAAETLARMESLMLARRSEIGHPHPQRAILYALMMVEAMLKDVILFSDRRSPALATTDDELREELTRACLAYLEIAR